LTSISPHIRHQAPAFLIEFQPGKLVHFDFFGKIYSLKADTIQRFLLTRLLRAYLAAETSFEKNTFPVGETCRFAFLESIGQKCQLITDAWISSVTIGG
jgi:hypothetical protein